MQRAHLLQGSRIEGPGLREGFRVEGVGSGVYGLGLRVVFLGFWVEGLGFRV